MVAERMEFFAFSAWNKFVQISENHNLNLFTLKNYEYLASYFSLQYPSWIKCKGQENKGNDHHIMKFLIV